MNNVDRQNESAEEKSGSGSISNKEESNEQISSLAGSCNYDGADPVLVQPSDSGHSGHTGAAVSQFSPASAPKIPPGEEQAKTALERSPRHGEYVDLKIEGSHAKQFTLDLRSALDYY